MRTPPPETFEITLGRVHFYLQKREAAPEAAELFANLKKAYQKLVDYFGEELMTFPEDISLPIIIDPVMPSDGWVRWKNNISLLPDGSDFVLNQPSTLEAFCLRDNTEAVIAHEFVHLFLQLAAMLSNAFVEGLAHAIQALLYESDFKNDSVVEPLIHMAEVERLLNKPLDFNGFDADYLEGGIRDGRLQNVVLALWEKKWMELIKRDPHFLRAFHTKLHELKKQGKQLMRKEEIVETARSISPEFAKLYDGEEGLMMHNMAEGEDEVPILAAVRSRQDNSIIGFNVTTNRKKVHPTTHNYTPPFAANKYRGDVFLWVSDPATGGKKLMQQVRFHEGEKVDAMFRIEGVTDEILNDPSLRVTIGHDIELPFAN